MRLSTEQERGQLRVVASVSASATDDLSNRFRSRSGCLSIAHFSWKLVTCLGNGEKGGECEVCRGKGSTVHREKMSSPRKHRAPQKPPARRRLTEAQHRPGEEQTAADHLMWSHMGEAASLTPGICELGFRGRVSCT